MRRSDNTPTTVGLVAAVVGVVLSCSAVVATPTPAHGAVPAVIASLVRTVDTSTLSPPIPDPAGITYLPGRDRFLVVDSEVDETPVFAGSNLFELDRDGVMTDRGTTIGYTKEAAGIGGDPSTGHVFISDDDQFRVHEVAPGPDHRIGTADDTRTSFSTAAFGSTDPEDVVLFPPTGELFVLDGADHAVHRVDPGPDGRFDGVAPAGDDTVLEVDVRQYGAEDPEGIGYHPGRGTLVVVDSTSGRVYELNRELMLVSIVDISASGQVFAAGITVAPSTTEAGRYDLVIVDRGVDNDQDPAENDGRLYRMRVDLPAIGNLAPVVDAGRDAPVQVGDELTLRARVRDDGRPGPGTTLGWAQVSGPGPATFSTPGAAQSSVRFPTPGTYVLRVTASDGAATTSDDVRVTVVERGAPLPLDTPVAKAFDDVEQRPTGYADWLGGTLNIPRAGTNAQTVGIRFDELEVPVGATITEAWIQFRASGTDSGAASVQVAGILQPDTATFTTSATTVSSRPRTQAAVTWAPAPWSSGQAGTAQRTSDLRTIVQEVVRQPAWRPGNALAVVMTGTGERRASSHDGAAAPVLHLAYTSSATANTPPVAAFTSSCSGLSCTFDGTASSDAEGPVTYRWTFSDGGTSTGSTTGRDFAGPGAYDVVLTVTDSSGESTSTTRRIDVTAPDGGAVAFRAVDRAVANATSASVRIAPAVRAGDLLLLLATVNLADATVTAPPGWTQRASFVTGTQRTLLWQREATSGDPGGTVAVSSSTTTKMVLQLAAYAGASPTTSGVSVLTRAETTRSTGHVTPAASVSGEGRWAVSYWADKSSTTLDWLPPAAVAVRDESIGSGSGRVSALLADSGGPVASGPTGGLTATTDDASRAATITVVLQPR